MARTRIASPLALITLHPPRALIVLIITALAAVLVIPIAANAQSTSCNGQAVTVDLALGQLPTDGDDVIAGTEGPDAIAAGAGDDVICGAGGDDIIYGQAGDDTILGGEGADKLRGGAGNDTVVGGGGADDVSGGTGNDEVRGGAGDDLKVRGGTGDDFVYGDEGNDVVVAGNGGSDQVFGGAGNDKVTGGPRPDILRGEAGDDVLRGLKGADTLIGGTGDDTLFGGAQPDTLDGGTGFDRCNGGTTEGDAVENDLAVDCEDLTNIENALISTPTPSPTPAPAPTPPPPAPLPAEGDAVVDEGGIAPPVGPPIEPPPGGGPPPQSGLLTAADVDDNLNFEFFTDYLSRQQQAIGSVLPDANLTDRLAVRFLDGSRNPLSNAMVEVSEGDNTVVAYANAEGILYLYPRYSGLDPAPIYSAKVTDAASGIVGQRDLAVAELSGDFATDLIVIPVTPDVERRQAMDVAFVIDATGSMGDEINYLKAEFSAIVRNVTASYPNVDLRFALVVYRDIGDDYVTRAFDFATAEEMLDNLARQTAAGGGDRPEAMETALQVADGLSWRTGDVNRVAILNADAPPHDENLGTALDAVESLRNQGVRMYPLAASGVSDTAEYLMRIMAATTGGRHLFLTDDSGIGGSHQAPLVACYVVTRLDQLLQRMLETELAGERVEPGDNEIIRSVGDYDNGVCGDLPVPELPEPPLPGPPDLPIPPFPPGEQIGKATLSGPFRAVAWAEIGSFVIAESDPEQITVAFVGSPAECMGATAYATVLEGEVLLNVAVGPRTDIDDLVCIALAVEHRLTIQLTEGLAGREVRALPASPS